jgi:cobalt-zinc-cadmium efflux system membrane fusion protein
MTIQSNFLKIVAAIAFIGALGAIAYFPAAQQRNARSNQSKKPVAVPPGQVTFSANAPQLSSLKVVALNAVPLPVSDPVNGRVTYDESLTARVSSPIAGRVIALHAEPGDRVARGFVMAAIDAPELATAEADWRKAVADERRKYMSLERAQTLYGGEVLALKDLESAQADHEQAKAETRRAALRMKNLNATGQEQGAFGLRSPIAGTVADRQINPGQEVRPDLAAPLFVVTDLRHLWVIADVAERSAVGLRPGQPVMIETDAYPGERFAARVDRIGLILDPGTRRVQVRCAVLNADLKLKPEMFAKVFFLPGDGAKKAIAVTNASLFVEGMYDFVFVESRPGTFAKRRVNVALRGHDTSFIDAGLASGERIVSEGAFLLNAEVAANAQ